MLDRDEQLGNETCRRLIAAASEVFARHGYNGARVRQIAEAAGVNLAAVNYYFGGKEGLYRATLRHLAAQSNGNAHGTADESPEERVQRRIRAVLERINGERPPALGRILAHEAMAPTGNLEALLAGTKHPELEQLCELLREVERLHRSPMAEK